VTGLTPISGPEAANALAESLAQVGELVPYLKADIGAVNWVRPGTGVETMGDETWLSCQDLTTDSDWLGKVIEGTGRAIGTDDQVVAASLFVQGYSYRLLALALASLTVTGVVPESSPGSLAVRLGRGRASKISYLNPKVFRLTNGGSPGQALSDGHTADKALSLLLTQVIEGHLRPLIAATRMYIQIGQRLLWGNVAASASTAFRTMEGCLGPWVEPLGLRFFELAPPDLQGLGSFLLIERPGRRGWFWERTNCCLFYQIEGKAKCADCSLTSDADRRQAYMRSLTVS